MDTLVLAAQPGLGCAGRSPLLRSLHAFVSADQHPSCLMLHCLPSWFRTLAVHYHLRLPLQGAKPWLPAAMLPFMTFGQATSNRPNSTI